ncbi:unnamed protein product [Lactuca virosa]|uniref:Uncharacterized protein n=1 Tax=Lactuca virosa TaxID=75947 RepID=A0AAU9LWZ2_9ASTR|nr:unnamed protein product [Lactuca virosa]
MKVLFAGVAKNAHLFHTKWKVKHTHEHIGVFALKDDQGEFDELVKEVLLHWESERRVSQRIGCTLLCRCAYCV